MGKNCGCDTLYYNVTAAATAAGPAELHINQTNEMENILIIKLGRIVAVIAAAAVTVTMAV